MAESADTPEAEPKHVRLRRFLTDQLARGVYRAGQFLPSEPELARDWGLSRGTVRQALAGLEEEGLVERVQGRGTIVRSASSPPDKPQLAVLAIVLPELRGGVYPALIHGFDKAAGEANQQILACSTDNDVRKQGDVVLQLIDKRVAGAAIVPPTVGPACTHQIRQLQAHGIPVVLLHRGVDGVSAPVIPLPYRAISAMAGRILADRGHRRVAVIQSHRSTTGPTYVEGLRDELRRAGGDVPDELVHYGHTPISDQFAAQERDVIDAVDRLLALPAKRRPTAIFDPWDSVTELIYLELQKRDVRVPDQMSLVSFGGCWRSTPLSRRLSAVTVDEAATGQLAAQLLGEMSSGARDIEDRQAFTIPLQFHEGETIGPAPATG